MGNNTLLALRIITMCLLLAIAIIAFVCCAYNGNSEASAGWAIVIALSLVIILDK